MSSSLEETGRRVVRETLAADLAAIISRVVGDEHDGIVHLQVHNATDDTIRSTASFFGDLPQVFHRGTPGQFISYTIQLEPSRRAITLYGDAAELPPSDEAAAATLYGDPTELPPSDEQATAATLISGCAS